MVRSDIGFQATLTEYKAESRDENVFTYFCLKKKAEGEEQEFLKSYEKKCGLENIQSLFKTPIHWKSIPCIFANQMFEVEFDELQFDAKLVRISVSKTFKKGDDHFEYKLFFEKEYEKGDFLHTYLKQKDEEGKLIEYPVALTPIKEFTEVKEESNVS